MQYLLVSSCLPYKFWFRLFNFRPSSIVVAGEYRWFVWPYAFLPENYTIFTSCMKEFFMHPSPIFDIWSILFFDTVLLADCVSFDKHALIENNGVIHFSALIWYNILFKDVSGSLRLSRARLLLTTVITGRHQTVTLVTASIIHDGVAS